MPTKTSYRNTQELGQAIAAARGQRQADFVLRQVHVLDVFAGEFVKTDLAWADGRIIGLGSGYHAKEEISADGLYAVPGFIDAHVHIESSLMTPARFEESVLPCGTTSVIWDPHEIANVWGQAGIDWALASSENMALDVFVMVPSCVPSTNAEFELESSGAQLFAHDIAGFRSHPRVLGLAEMMNFPGLLNQDPDVMQKLLDYQGLKRDGHCPGLSGQELNAYAVAGIHSCHESTTLTEAREKLMKGIHVLIREGSCAKDARELLPLLTAYSSATLAFCSDDRNPLDISEEGHISRIVELGLTAGKNPIDVFRAASFGAARIYGLDDRGALAPGYLADLCLVQPKAQDWHQGFVLHSVFKRGIPVSQKFRSAAKSAPAPKQKNLILPEPSITDLQIPAHGSRVEVEVIDVIPGQILTQQGKAQLAVQAGAVQADPNLDFLKLAVFERHQGLGTRSTAIVRGFGIKRGAIATSINHDAHNIICVGSSDALMLAAIQRLMMIDGGIVVVGADASVVELPLPIAGLMTDASPEHVAQSLRMLKTAAHAIGCVLEEPFLQLSFLALPVIPQLKLTDRGLVDVQRFVKIPVVRG